MCLQDTTAEEISSRDKQALSYCTAIRASYPSKGGAPTLEMSFSANPFFSNSVLKRCLGDGEVEEMTTDIEWKDTAHKLTVKVGVWIWVAVGRGERRAKRVCSNTWPGLGLVQTLVIMWRLCRI